MAKKKITLTIEELSEIRREAGRKGGNATKARHGKGFYAHIGSLGGKATKAKKADEEVDSHV